MSLSLEQLNMRLQCMQHSLGGGTCSVKSVTYPCSCYLHDAWIAEQDEYSF